MDGRNRRPGFFYSKKRLTGQFSLAVGDLHEDGSASFREILIDFAPHDGVDGTTWDGSGYRKRGIIYRLHADIVAGQSSHI